MVFMWNMLILRVNRTLRLLCYIYSHVFEGQYIRKAQIVQCSKVCSQSSVRIITEHLLKA